MIALNDKSILVGQIKQLLHNFNLPMCQIGQKNPYPSYIFIENDDIYHWDENLQKIYESKYLYNKNYLNITETLDIQNMIYDRNTHRYLGRYLRFLRDYHNVDLMSMYNCADLEEISNDVQLPNSKVFRKNDQNYITYQMPISYGVDLSLLVQSGQTFETFLYLASTEKKLTYDEDVRQNIANATYKKLRNIDVIYYNPTTAALTYINNITDENEKKKYIETLNKYWNQLYLIIKVPKQLNHSIVVLEGKYFKKTSKDTRYFRYQPSCDPNTDTEDMKKAVLVQQYNQYIGEEKFISTVTKDKRSGPYYYNYLAEAGFRINSQLLSHENAFANYLLADRLIEYLTVNAINPLSISDEIKRLQLALDSSREEYSSYEIYTVKESPNASINVNFYVQEKPNMYDAASEILFYVQATASMNQSTQRNRQYGIWSYLDQQDLRSIAYRTEVNLEKDVVGYLDKDLENILKEKLDNASV